jgi:hypothetical protein
MSGRHKDKWALIAHPKGFLMTLISMQCQKALGMMLYTLTFVYQNQIGHL